jgi:hypothetical protein
MIAELDLFTQAPPTPAPRRAETARNVPPNARALVAQVKTNGEDREFYPTTNAIIDALVADVRAAGEHWRADDFRPKYHSALDIGAGNGKVLTALKEQASMSELYAIEISPTLCAALPEWTFIVGTDFQEQSLLSKAVDVVFCNPPYSQFETWAEKIVRQSASQIVYLVLPERWSTSRTIADALEYREATAKVLGNFDFEDAEDRTARAKVQLLKISLDAQIDGKSYQRDADDAFKRFFHEQFAELIGKFNEKKKEPAGEREKRGFESLVVGPNYPAAMVSIYNEELSFIERNYELVSKLDVDLLKEFAIDPARVMGCLQQRLTGLRSDYWHELFGHLGSITDKLCSKTRKTMLDTLQKNLQVDFTLGNILAVVVWACKNANKYIDSQLVDVYEEMVEKCNVVLYKSNQRTWRDEQWRYYNDGEKPSHYALDYRIVTHRHGGLRTGYSFEKGLTERSCEFLGDLLTIARNLGFDCKTTDPRLIRPGREEWTSERQVFTFNRATAGAPYMQPLFDCRAYFNGNVHLRFNKKFILALNVEHGRLKGWLHTGQQAADELRDPLAKRFFNTNLQLPISDPGLMLTQGDK